MMCPLCSNQLCSANKKRDKKRGWAQFYYIMFHDVTEQWDLPHCQYMMAHSSSCIGSCLTTMEGLLRCVL